MNLMTPEELDRARCRPELTPTLRCDICLKFNDVVLLCKCEHPKWRPTRPDEWTDLFHPRKGRNLLHWPEKFCAVCPVKAECLAEAIANPQAAKWGIYGGTSEMQRRMMRRGVSLRVVCAVCGRETGRRSISQTLCDRASCREGLPPIDRRSVKCPKGHAKQQSLNGRWYCVICADEHNKVHNVKRKALRAAMRVAS